MPGFEWGCQDPRVLNRSLWESCLRQARAHMLARGWRAVGDKFEHVLREKAEKLFRRSRK
jgi:hypothetical protein